MSGPAIIMMIIALVLVWGGLVAAIVHLRAHPESADDDADLSEGAPAP